MTIIIIIIVARTVSLQQTVPPEGVPVCPLDTLKYTCVEDGELNWKVNGLVKATYIVGSMINDTNTPEIFTFLLINITGNTLTSTATIEKVSLEDDGTNISCVGNDPSTGALKHVQVEGITISYIFVTLQPKFIIMIIDAPVAPNNLAITTLDTCTSLTSVNAVNLTWSLNRSRCMVVYQIEITTSNSFICSNTTSRHTLILLNIGVMYSIRIRAIDKFDRTGNWAEMTYTAGRANIKNAL